jgi:hypothetical protein
MTARVRRIAVAFVAAALSAGLGAGVVAASGHQTTPQRVLADGHWCC